MTSNIGNSAGGPGEREKSSTATVTGASDEICSRRQKYISTRTAKVRRVKTQ
jgi:hypothetical protein